MEPIINKVAESGLVTIDLETYYPKNDLASFDLKPYLFMELILKEKDFRAALQQTDWEQYREKYVALFCSADAIIPVWAYMLVASYLQPVARFIAFVPAESLPNLVLHKKLDEENWENYLDKRVVVKGCGDVAIPESAYVSVTARLRPYAKSIMYGEPCSTVPIYKKR